MEAGCGASFLGKGSVGFMNITYYNNSLFTD